MSNKDIRTSWDNFIKYNEQHFISNKELQNNNLTELKTFIDLNKRRSNRSKETKKVLVYSWPINLHIEKQKIIL